MLTTYQYTQLEESEYKCVKKDNIPPNDTLVQYLKNWKYLDRVVDSTIHIKITTRLLESGTLEYLKYLEVSLKESRIDEETDTAFYNRDKLKGLLPNIQNAPLTGICLSSTTINLNNLEELHSKLPKLEVVTLNNVFLYNDECRNTAVTQAAESVKSIRLNCAPIDEEFLEDDENEEEEIPVMSASYIRTHSNWISYMAKKYPNLQQLKISSSTDDQIEHEQAIELFEHPLLGSSSNMKRISDYQVTIYPLTTGILNALDKNGVKLEKIPFGPLYSTNPESEFQSLMSAECVKPVKELNISYHRQPILRPLTFCVSLKNLATRLDYLTVLSIRGRASLLVFILRNLTMLETLYFNILFMHPKDNEEIDSILKHLLVDFCKIKVLYLRIGAFQQQVPAIDERRVDRRERQQQQNQQQQQIYENKKHIQRISGMLNWVLKSCPHLIEFYLTGWIYTRIPGTILLSFNHLHNRNTSIILNIQGCQYYTMSIRRLKERNGLAFIKKNKLNTNQTSQTSVLISIYNSRKVSWFLCRKFYMHQ